VWTYRQKTGELLQDGVVKGAGYAGHGEGKNNPALEHVHDVGPISRGNWSIVGPPDETSGHGPYVLGLEPFPGTNTFGRGGFLIHGDSVSKPGTASLGCICLPRVVRVRIWESGDHGLVVE
jgi:hypothetical protein